MQPRDKRQKKQTIWDRIIDVLVGKQKRKLEKELKNNPEIKKALEDTDKSIDKFIDSVDDFCKKYGDC